MSVPPARETDGRSAPARSERVQFRPADAEPFREGRRFKVFGAGHAVGNPSRGDRESRFEEHPHPQGGRP